MKHIVGYVISNNCAMTYQWTTGKVSQGRDRYLLAKMLVVASRKAITRNRYKADPPGKKHWFDMDQEIYLTKTLTELFASTVSLRHPVVLL